MTTAFEVETIFRIVNRASPTITAILRQIRQLNEAIDLAKKNLGELAGAGSASLAPAIGETERLATAWKAVATEATSARRAISSVSRAALPAPGGVATATGGGGGGRALLGNRLGIGGNAHYTPPGYHVPTGGHFRIGGLVGGAAAAFGYAGLQAANYEDAAVFMAQHAGVDYLANREKFENILKEATTKTGYSEHEVSEATQDVLRQFKYTGGDNGVGVLPNILRYGATEARLKNTGLKESESAMVGLAHMLRKYSAEDVEKLAPAFSVLSVANPMSLAQMDTAFGYAVPLLQAGMDLDPFQTMAASTALATAGIKSSRAGTWVREMMKGAMPGTSLMSKMRFNKHEAALRELGLVDDNHKPTWFVNGKPDEFSFLEKVSENLPNIPIERRAAILEALAGTRGAGALSVLAETPVQERMKKLHAAVNDPAEINRVRNFQEIYAQQSTKQNARQTFQTFNVLMADLGDKILPSVNHALGDFKGALEFITKLIPGAKKEGGDIIGARAMQGVGLGAAAGWFLGPGGVGLGGLVGGGIGTMEGVLETYHKNRSKEEEKRDDDIQSQILLGVGGLSEAIKMPQKTQLAPITVQMNIDGKAIGDAVFNAQAGSAGFSTQAPAGNGTGQFNDPTHNLSGN